MSMIEKATKHYASQNRLIIDVPEWDTQIHILPMTMAEVNMIQKIANKKASNIEQAVNMIIVKAKDADGNRLFSLSDRDTLLQNADYRVVSRIARQKSKAIYSQILRCLRET